MTLHGAVEYLGSCEDEHEVAELIQLYEIRGVRRCKHRCPLALLLSALTGTTVRVSTTKASNAEENLFLPYYVRLFVASFDQGLYSDLIDSSMGLDGL